LWFIDFAVVLVFDLFDRQVLLVARTVVLGLRRVCSETFAKPF
jgi:hypothetical protein